MNIQYVYTRKRSQFGRPLHLTDQPPQILAEIQPNFDLLQHFIYRNPVDKGIQHSIEYSQHEINTTHANQQSKSLNHIEGGWPKDVNIQEQDQMNRYRKKILKDPLYLRSLQQLIHDMELSIKQNNAINIHQNYFNNEINESDNQSYDAKTVNLYSYELNQNQMVNHICWKPDEQNKIVVSYANLEFTPLSTTPTPSLIWDIENPTKPEMILESNSSLTTVEYHPKDTNQILAGSINGQVYIYDLRKGTKPVEQSLLEHSHHEVVKNALWIQSKSGNEFFSASSDGNIYWWDMKKMNQPIDKFTLLLNDNKKTPITKLEYDSTISTKFMIGTETGHIVLCTQKPKNDTDRINVIYPGHFGPVYSIQRHPLFSKIFLSVGDWCGHIWSEEIRDDYIFSTKSERCYLTDAQWCPGRPAVFISSTTEGTIDIWDLLFKQDQATLSIKISEEPVSCLRFNDPGRYVACGTKNGNVILVELSDNLCMIDQNEKQLVATMFDSETRRSRLLDSRLRMKHDKQYQHISIDHNENLEESTKQFWSIINEEKQKLLST